MIGAEDDLHPVDWVRRHPGGGNVLPVLKDAIASFDCPVRSVLPSDEHLVIFGLVKAATPRSEAAPLLHRRRAYWTLGEGIKR